MSKKKALILLICALLIAILMIKPYNLFCRYSDKCQPIILSYYAPTTEGNENYQLFFEAKDSNNDVMMEVPQRSVIIASGQKAEIEYRAKNISDHDLKIRPKVYTFPTEAQKYIKFYECLCFRDHKIKKGDEIKMVVKFKLLRAIEEDPFFKDLREIRVGYEI